MADLTNGQRVTHKSVRGVMKVNKVAVKKGYTRCQYQVNGRTIQEDFPTDELVPVADVKIPSPINECAQLLEQAVLKLMDEGIERSKAIERVERNFFHLSNSNLTVTLAAICSENPFDPDWN
ncbi:hypothetical protein [Shewanella oncorhynchi]|uniref:hypothetical protein n=1 Tax=Shewanella oncorhynchi TaxID=2726434 RepID=UPI003D7940C8